MTALRLAFGILALSALGALSQPAPASADATPSDPRAVIQRMLDRNPSLQSYRARVHVDVRMLSFPFLAPKLDGTTYYRRPDTYQVIFDKMPSYAKNFQRLFDDIGDPAAWEKDQNVTLDAPQTLDGRETIVLRLTKKIHSTILDHTLAYVDPATYELLQMEWDYTSGGKIVMTQHYRQEGPYTILSTQHADISIPHVHAVADAAYSDYQTNIPPPTGLQQ